MDMEALFAEMRKAQTGGRDFAAEAAAKREREDADAAAAANASDASDDSDDSDDADDAMPPRGMSKADEARLLRVSQAGRAAVSASRRRGRGRHDDDDDDDDDDRPSPALEAARHRAVAALASKFEASCARVLGGRWWSHYESWLYARRAAAGARDGGGGGGDAVIPDPELAKSDPELRRKLVAAGLSAYDANGVGMELARAAARAIAQVGNESAGAGHRKPVKLSVFDVGGGAGPDDERYARGERAATAKAKAKLTCGKVSVECNAAHLEKLRALHRAYARRRGGGGGGRRRARARSAADDERIFREDAFSLLARYSSLQGAHYKAGAMQAALPPAMFDALREHFDVSMELCASPFNCRWRRYCGAALDVDAAFGSLGSGAFYFHTGPRTTAFAW
jgi:phosphorylated CTD-interacting factor 1